MKHKALIQTERAKHLKEGLHLLLTSSLVLILSLSLLLVGCGNSQNKNTNGTSEGTEETFGDAFNNLNQDGTQLSNTVALQADAVIYPISDFVQLALQDKDDFIAELNVALRAANLQQTPETEIVRMDTVDFLDVFEILTLCKPGNAEIMVREWQAQHPGDSWTYDYAEDDRLREGPQGYFDFDLLFIANGDPYCEFFGRWVESEQYLFAVYRTAYIRFEVDIIRTADGWAIQTYEPEYDTAYRMAFSLLSPYNGGIGVCYGEFPQQPRTLSSEEPIDFATRWPEIGGMRQVAYLQLLDEDLYVTSSGDDAEMVYSVRPNFGQEPAGFTGSLGMARTTTGGPALNAEAQKYVGLWHGSPVVAAGWNERFVLYPNGTFIWCANEMDGSQRLRYLVGFWNVRNSTLALDCRAAINWEGGQEIANEGLAGYISSTVIINPTPVVYSIEKTLTMPLSEITFDNDRGLNVVTINMLECWDYSDQYYEGPGGPVQDFQDCLKAANSQSGAATGKGEGSGAQL